MRRGTRGVSLPFAAVNISHGNVPISRTFEFPRLRGLMTAATGRAGTSERRGRVRRHRQCPAHHRIPHRGLGRSRGRGRPFRHRTARDALCRSVSLLALERKSAPGPMRRVHAVPAVDRAGTALPRMEVPLRAMDRPFPCFAVTASRPRLRTPPAFRTLKPNRSRPTDQGQPITEREKSCGPSVPRCSCQLIVATGSAS